MEGRGIQRPGMSTWQILRAKALVSFFTLPFVRSQLDDQVGQIGAGRFLEAIFQSIYVQSSTRRVPRLRGRLVAC